MKRIHVECIGETGEELALSPEATHHLIHVMRFEVGRRVVLFDGGQRQAIAELSETDGDKARVRILSIETVPDHRIHTTLILGLPKGPATDLAIRMATEAGVSRILVVWADRTQGRPRREDRWRRILTSAAQQSGRIDVPELHPPMSLDDALQTACDADALFYGDASGPPRPSHPIGSVALAIGPEGGWSEGELAMLASAGGVPLSFAPHTLRTETAAAIGVALCSTLPGNR